MRSLMDEVRFQRAEDGGTQVILRKWRAPPGRRSETGAECRLMLGEDPSSVRERTVP
jgi:hypothetical protein